MIFHENCLLADNSHEISYLIFFRNLGMMSQNLSSAAVVIGALRIKVLYKALPNTILLANGDFCRLPITFANCLDPDH